nr:PLD nuclease N-terminal domain-containing protein [Phytoactinopolyspora alkaliphila]
MPVVVALILAVYALIDCLQTDSARIRSLNKPAWMAIILLIPVVGPILWLVTGKPGAQPRPRPAAPKAAPLPPDDNPEFLRELRNLDDEHEKLLNEWEESLRRREEEYRKQHPDPNVPDPGAGAPDEKKKPKREDGGAEEELRKRGDGGDDDAR